MRKVVLAPAPLGGTVRQTDPQVRWLTSMVREIAEASHEEIPGEIADAYTVTNLAESRTLDCDTATLAQLCDVVGTLITDLQKRAVNKTKD